MKNQTIISLLCCLLMFVTGCSTSHQGNTYDIMTYGAKGDGQTDAVSYTHLSGWTSASLEAD